MREMLAEIPQLYAEADLARTSTCRGSRIGPRPAPGSRVLFDTRWEEVGRMVRSMFYWGHPADTLEEACANITDPAAEPDVKALYDALVAIVGEPESDASAALLHVALMPPTTPGEIEKLLGIRAVTIGIWASAGRLRGYDGKYYPWEVLVLKYPELRESMHRSAD